MPRPTAPFLVAGLGLTACFSPAEPVAVRWFTPPVAATRTQEPAPATRPPLRLDRVTGAAHLGVAMVWRVSNAEVALDDVHRWVDEPAALVGRALDAALFGSGRFTPGDPGGARLSAHVDAFEAVLGEEPLARIEVELLLDPGDGAPLRRERMTDVRSLLDTDPATVARALGDALGELAAKSAVWCAADELR